MRGTTAKNLRRVARELGLDPKTSYLQAAQRTTSKREVAPECTVLTECLRKAYKEAKRIYKRQAA
jgi:hypothetical protein